MRNTLLASGLVLVAGSAMAEEPLSFTTSPVQVEATALPALKELDPVGKSNQPTWTTSPRFTFSNVYTLPEGVRTARVDAQLGSARNSSTGAFSGSTYGGLEVLETAEVGLGNGWQVGVSLVQDAYDSEVFDEIDLGGKLEVRKSIAPWGEIWGNPTLAASYTKREEGRDTLKAGVLLGGNITDKISWAANANFAHGFGQLRSNKGQFTGGAMYSVIDNTLAVGLEAVVEVSNTRQPDALGVLGYNNSNFAGVGPSVSWRPVVAGRTLNVHGAVLLVDTFFSQNSGGSLTSSPQAAVGVSYNF